MPEGKAKDGRVCLIYVAEDELRCWRCNAIISPGTEYTRHKYVSIGTPLTYPTCKQCYFFEKVNLLADETMLLYTALPEDETPGRVSLPRVQTGYTTSVRISTPPPRGWVSQFVRKIKKIRLWSTYNG